MYTLKTIGLLLFVGIATGCAIGPFGKNENQSGNSEQASQLIARDLVGVLYQVESLNPESTVLLLPDDDGQQAPFEAALHATLQNAGYAIRTAGGGASTLAVSYSIDRSVDLVQGTASTYTVNMGNVSVRRTYQMQDQGSVLPLAAMQIRGADASRLSLSNSLFDNGENSEFSQEARQKPQTSQPSEFTEAVQPAVAAASTPTPTVTESFAQPIALADRPTVTKQPLERKVQSPIDDTALLDKPKQNIRDIGASNFANVLDTLVTVNEAILVFDNDSIHFGEANKARVRDLIRQFNPLSDVFSVIGCSNGPSLYTGGQQALALGRADRVKESLLFAGVPEANILDEACWATEHFDDSLPRRGVVLAHKRRI